MAAVDVEPVLAPADLRGVGGGGGVVGRAIQAPGRVRGSGWRLGVRGEWLGVRGQGLGLRA